MRKEASSHNGMPVRKGGETEHLAEDPSKEGCRQTMGCRINHEPQRTVHRPAGPDEHHALHMAGPFRIETSMKTDAYVERGKWVTDHIGPINAVITLSTATLLPVLDFLRPYFPYISYVAAVAVMLFLVLLVMKIRGLPRGAQLHSSLVVCAGVCAAAFSVGAIASAKHADEGGLLASVSHRIKTWQDQYLTDIKQDTELIKKQTADNSAKLDKTNMMLAQLLDGIRPELEKPLVEQISGYKTLPEHQQNALLLLTSKVGVNGIRRYKRLMQAVNTYSDQRTPENAKVVTQYLTYIVRINGKDVEDTKTEKLLTSLFLDPETYAYLMGIGAAPQDQGLLKAWNIDLSKPAGEQLDDPLGGLIKALTAAGKPTEKQVVIPANENTTPQAEGDSQASPSQKEKQHKHRDKSNHGRGGSVYLS
ncbi:hypothetical protein [Ralstonia sp. SET104]|uniref:hypothetical protein n=1 Tax=Ralstonia sp. SET104 TaxID=2448774 RepID=UPI0021A98F0B|nr:hypothetical protein [Ralstonia sp. SET104]